MTSVIRSSVIFLLPLSTKHAEKHVDLFALEFGSVPILWYFYLFFILLDLTDYNDNRSVRGWGARMSNRKLRDIRRGGATGSDVTGCSPDPKMM